MPAYNAAPYIQQALDSLFAQQFASLEIIVVDDGSTDETPQIVAAQAGRVCLLRQPNGGPAAARNTGLQAARGEFVCFLDADDVMLPGKLVQQVAYLMLRPQLGLVHSGWRIIDEEGNLVQDVEPWRQLPQIVLERFVHRRAAKLGPMMFRRAWLDSVGGFDPSLRHAEDVDLIFRLLLAGCQAEWIYRPTICYRVHAGSTLHREAELQSACLPAVLDKLFAHPGLPEVVRRKETAVRYFDEVWLAWHAWRMARAEAIQPHLQQAFVYAAKAPELAVLEWWHLCAGWTELDGRDVQSLSRLLPLMLDVAAVPDALRPLLSELLNWWQANQPVPAFAFSHPQQAWLFWQNAGQRTVEAPQFSLTTWLDWWTYGWRMAAVARQPLDAARFHHLSAEQLIMLLKISIVMDAERVGVEEVTAVWQNILTQELLPASMADEVAALYLTLFGQAAMGRQGAAARAALRRLAGLGVNWTVLRAWGRFIRASLAFAFH
jgi:glycosyltransferase involved in cell wall biosynthesis